MAPPSLTRRRILAAVGSAGALYVGVDRVGAAVGLDPVDTNQRTVNGTYAQSTEFTDAPPRIAIDWRETVNGSVQEETSLTTDGESGAVGLIVDEAVMPGDSGSVTMRVQLLEREDQPTQNAQLYLKFPISDDSENGINDPEQAAGDATPNDGELDEFTEVRVWKDESPIGTGDGEWDGIPVIGDTEISSGTLEQVSNDIGGGTRLAVDGETCLSPGTELYVSFQWSVPASVGNVIQGDSATFQVGFEPRTCGSE
jgi:hypothetical protein